MTYILQKKNLLVFSVFIDYVVLIPFFSLIPSERETDSLTYFFFQNPVGDRAPPESLWGRRSHCPPSLSTPLTASKLKLVFDLHKHL